MNFFLGATKKNTNLNQEIVDLLKSNSEKTHDGVDGCCLQIGEVLRNIKDVNIRFQLQAELQMFLQNRLKELTS